MNTSTINFLNILLSSPQVTNVYIHPDGTVYFFKMGNRSRMALHARYHRAYVDIFERDRLEPDWVPYDTFTYDTFDKWVVSEDV